MVVPYMNIGVKSVVEYLEKNDIKINRMSTFTLVCAAIYILSFIAHIIFLWVEEGKNFYRIGDVIDSIEFYMWFPILNTLLLILIVIEIIVYGLYKLLRLDVAWNWFMNIKLK